MNEYEDLSLAELFAEADAIGNKYQTPEEIAALQTELDRLCADLWEA